ncbi:MAG TPA: hypothetical protein VD994_12955 [Prosthecobacter sp.]|nr:hypothetical protein [Prosthecobacter sp.]
MALKFKYNSKAEVPAEHSALYVERDGAFVLDVEGAVAKERLDEFRNNNTTLKQQLDALQASVNGVDLAKAKELLKKQQELDDANLVKSGDIDKIVQNRLAPFQQQLEAEKAAKAEVEKRLADVQINQAALAAGAKRGLRATAHADLLFRVKSAFRIVNGATVAFEADGKTMRYSKDGVTPLTLDEWVEGLATEAPHLFESSSGGGASGGSSGGAGLANGQKNPFKRETLNLTEQGRLFRTNPALAKQMQAAAGR